jgi:hypothetical protein
MKVQGSCRCGKITYAADVDPESVIICSCVDSAASVATPAGSFRLHSGDPMRFVGVAESGTIRLDSVCADCGSVIYSSAATESFAAAEPQKYWLYTSWLKERSKLCPKKVIRCRLTCGTMDMKQPPPGMEKREDLRPTPNRTMVCVLSNAALLQRSRILQKWTRALREAVKQSAAESHEIVAYSKTTIKLSERRALERPRK